MAWDWVPPREGDESGPPSRRLGMIVTILSVVLTLIVAVSWAAGSAGAAEEQCVADRPSGVAASQVGKSWQWWPPKWVCRYEGAAV